MIAQRALVRRKVKNLSSILAITLGVTLLVGIQITTDTLENTFLTTLLQTEGEVDIRVSNATVGGYLSVADETRIEALLPDAVGIMAELSTQLPVMMGSQFDPSAPVAGIPLDYPKTFGYFYEWGSGKEMQIRTYLADNSSVLLSSRLAEDLAMDQDVRLPVALNTEFTSVSVSVSIDPNTGPSGEGVSITHLAGTGFVHDASVWFQMAGQPDLIGCDVVVESPETITFSVSLS